MTEVLLRENQVLRFLDEVRTMESPGGLENLTTEVLRK